MSAEEPANYVYGMNEELLLAWRAKLETPSEKVLSLPLQESWEDGKPPDDAIIVVAQWYDGHDAEIPGLSWGRLRKMHADRQSTSPAFGNLFDGTQKGTKHRITVSQRVDRRLLLCMYEQESLVLSINIGDFAFVENEHEQQRLEHPAVQRAMQFMKPFYEQFVAGTIKRDELRAAKNDKLKAEGISNRRKPAPRKTPATATTAAAPAQATLPKSSATATANDTNERRRLGAKTNPKGAKVPKTSPPQRRPEAPPAPERSQAVDPEAAPVEPEARPKPGPPRGENPWVEYRSPEPPPLMTMTMLWEAQKQRLLGNDTR